MQPYRNQIIALGLVVVTLSVYWQVGRHEFVNYDDNVYVTDNPYVRGGLTADGVVWAFTTTWGANWHPVTWLSHMLDVQLFGMSSGPHHLMNVAFHVVNTLLLFAVFLRMTKSPWQSGFVAALFALHPMHVESVAWASERKDVLCTFFWMLTMWTYVRYVEKPGRLRLWLSLALFALGLMTKAMLVTLPFVLLLLDVWPLRRIECRWGEKSRRDAAALVREKIPFFVLVAAACAVTYWAQRSEGAVVAVEKLAFGHRVGNAVVAYGRYTGKLLWPDGMAVFYPYERPWTAVEIAGAAVLLAGITVFTVRAMLRHPYLGVGWFWYLGTLVPVIGLVQVGEQSIADRYTYIPYIGLFVIVAWGATDLIHVERLPKSILQLLAGAVIVACGVVSYLQVRHWKDGVALFSHALAVTGDNYVAHNNLGTALLRRGNVDDALKHFRESVRIKPENAESRVNFGAALMKFDRLDEALPHLRAAVRLKPANPEAQNNMGSALAKQGNFEDAIPYYLEAIRLKMRFSEAHHNLGVALGSLGRHDEAVAHFVEAIRLNPDFAEAHYNLGVALTHQGKLQEARQSFLTAQGIDPKFQPPQLEKLKPQNATGGR